LSASLPRGMLGSKEGVMTLAYDVRVADHVHRVRIEVPSGCNRRDLASVREFAISTALLEHLGYLPRDVVNGIA